jgi:hypothetical protein
MPWTEGFTCHKDLLGKIVGGIMKNEMPSQISGRSVGPLVNPFPGILGIHGELLNKTDIGKSCAKINITRTSSLNPCCNWVNSKHLWYLKKLCLIHVHPFHHIYKHIASYMA